MRTRTILLASLMIMMTMTPLASAGMDKEIIEGKEIVDPIFGDAPARTIDDFGTRANTGASGRAPCNAVQTDAGSAGDAGNTSTTAKSLGTDPSLSLIHISEPTRQP